MSKLSSLTRFIFFRFLRAPQESFVHLNMRNFSIPCSNFTLAVEPRAHHCFTPLALHCTHQIFFVQCVFIISYHKDQKVTKIFQKTSKVLLQKTKSSLPHKIKTVKHVNMIFYEKYFFIEKYFVQNC